MIIGGNASLFTPAGTSNQILIAIPLIPNSKRIFISVAMWHTMLSNVFINGKSTMTTQRPDEDSLKGLKRSPMHSSFTGILSGDSLIDYAN